MFHFLFAYYSYNHFNADSYDSFIQCPFKDCFSSTCNGTQCLFVTATAATRLPHNEMSVIRQRQLLLCQKKNKCRAILCTAV